MILESREIELCSENKDTEKLICAFLFTCVKCFLMMQLICLQEIVSSTLVHYENLPMQYTVII